MKRILYSAIAALVAMMVLVPTALAQDIVPGDDHPHLPEANAVVVGSHEELEQIAGQPVPSPHPGQHPEPVPAAPTEGLPASGGPPVILPAAALLLLVGSAVLAYGVLRKAAGEERG